MANVNTVTMQDIPAVAGLSSSPPVRQAFQILHVAFTLAPILAGLDKFFHLLVNWDVYLAPWVAKLSPIGGHNLMLFDAIRRCSRDCCGSDRSGQASDRVALGLCVAVGNHRQFTDLFRFLRYRPSRFWTITGGTGANASE